MATPENKVKAAVKRVIEKYGSKIDSYWPVPSGYGESHLDCIMCVNGFYVSVETKAPGKKPTTRQKYRIGTVQRAGGYALVIDGTDATFTVDELDALLANLTKETK
jgi:hypothetical protein